MHRLTKLHQDLPNLGQKSLKNSAKTQQPNPSSDPTQTHSPKTQTHSHSNQNYNNNTQTITTPSESINAKKKEFSRTSPKQSQKTQKIYPNVSGSLLDPQLELFDCVLNVL